MNKFGLLDEEEPVSALPATMSEKLAQFPRVTPRPAIDLAAADAAAARHGFTSRELPEPVAPEPPHTRRRRAIPAEPTRHLAIRLTASAYARFVAYADRHQLTYHDALGQLLDDCGER